MAATAVGAAGGAPYPAVSPPPAARPAACAATALLRANGIHMMARAPGIGCHGA
jgi:hypothetical protein